MSIPDVQHSPSDIHGSCPCFIAVHIGVGQHSSKREKAYKTALREACQMGAQALQSTGDALHAAVAAVSTLEDAPLGNAGLDSNLTVRGLVQCDASVMAGDGAFGAIGAVSGVKNPVQVAGELARQSREPMPLGRVRPLFLAGDGARGWALEQGLPAAASAEAATQWHITESARRRWQRYKAMIDEDARNRTSSGDAITATGEPIAIESGDLGTSTEGHQMKRQRTGSAGASPKKTVQPARLCSWEEDSDCLAYDTVGAVCVDAQGRVAASVSSGGIAMKMDGRVGEAAMFGCGCWAADVELDSGRPAVACSVTGVGEAIMRAGLARACAKALAADAETAGDGAGALGDSASTVDAVCAREIRKRIEAGQPPMLPCPHRDCGVLAVRVSRSAAARGGLPRAGVVSGGAVGVPGGSRGAIRSGDTARTEADVATAGIGSVQDSIAQEDRAEAAEDRCGREGLGRCAPRNSGDCLIGTAELKETAHGSHEHCEGAHREQWTIKVEFGAVHNSHSMGFGYWVPGMNSPECTILRRQGNDAASADAGMCFNGSRHSWLFDVRREDEGA
ncbi:Threonine aspartase 1 at N-terminal half [Coccomyxa sp. Obi]|nr:Threonine aspartase 1 at N-terminal half [Coccomyxa sp. Obi]